MCQNSEYTIFEYTKSLTHLVWAIVLLTQPYLVRQLAPISFICPILSLLYSQTWAVLKSEQLMLVCIKSLCCSWFFIKIDLPRPYRAQLVCVEPIRTSWLTRPSRPLTTRLSRDPAQGPQSSSVRTRPHKTTFTVSAVGVFSQQNKDMKAW